QAPSISTCDSITGGNAPIASTAETNENARPARESEDPEHQKPMSSFLSPVDCKSCWKIGTSISTPLVVAGGGRSFGACAKPTTATSVICCVPSSRWRSQVVRERVIRRVGFAGRLEMVDVVSDVPFLARLPDGLDPHSHPDLIGQAAENQVLEGDVRAV